MRNIQFEMFDNEPLITVGEMNTSQEGAWREQLIVKDLMRRGYNVYTQASRNPFDIAAHACVDGISVFARVEVKAERSSRNIDWSKCDILAVVDENERIKYYVFDFIRGARKGIDPSAKTLGKIDGLKKADQALKNIENVLSENAYKRAYHFWNNHTEKFVNILYDGIFMLINLTKGISPLLLTSAERLEASDMISEAEKQFLEMYPILIKLVSKSSPNFSELDKMLGELKAKWKL